MEDLRQDVIDYCAEIRHGHARILNILQANGITTYDELMSEYVKWKSFSPYHRSRNMDDFILSMRNAGELTLRVVKTVMERRGKLPSKLEPRMKLLPATPETRMVLICPHCGEGIIINQEAQ